MSKAQLEIVADFECEVGEAPLWHPDEQMLYWVDIPKGHLFRYDPATGVSEKCFEGLGIGGFTIQADGALLLFTSAGAIMTWRNGITKTIVDESPARDFVFNDLIADPLGRVFAGVKAGEGCEGRIYRIDRDASIHMIADGLLEPNGFGFTLDRKSIYSTDSKKYERYLHSYNAGTGEISDKRVFIKVPEKLGVPDGMTVDSEGFVWSAQWNGGCVIRFAPDGAEERRIDLPVKKPSSITFGGRDYTDIFISTSRGDDWTDNSPGAGALFRINLGIRGVPEYWSRIGL